MSDLHGTGHLRDFSATLPRSESSRALSTIVSEGMALDEEVVRAFQMLQCDQHTMFAPLQQLCLAKCTATKQWLVARGWLWPQRVCLYQQTACSVHFSDVNFRAVALYMRIVVSVTSGCVLTG